MFYIYVLQSESDDGLYIGFSTDLRRRLKEHQEGKSFATSYRKPWRLIYYLARFLQADPTHHVLPCVRIANALFSTRSHFIQFFTGVAVP